VLRRLIRWLLGIPAPEHLEARRRFDAERSGRRPGAWHEASRSNLAGGKGSGNLSRDWSSWLR
jgi:hypothetical protein